MQLDMGRLKSNINGLDRKVNAAVAAITAYHAAAGEAYMKSTAPWTDRTGAARTGLNTAALSAGDVHTILFAHAVTYGIWLEVKYSGRDAVIMPSVLHIGHDLMQSLNHLLDKI